MKSTISAFSTSKLFSSESGCACDITYTTHTNIYILVMFIHTGLVGPVGELFESKNEKKTREGKGGRSKVALGAGGHRVLCRQGEQLTTNRPEPQLITAKIWYCRQGSRRPATLPNCLVCCDSRTANITSQLRSQVKSLETGSQRRNRSWWTTPQVFFCASLASHRYNEGQYVEKSMWNNQVDRPTCINGNSSERRIRARREHSNNTKFTGITKSLT